MSKHIVIIEDDRDLAAALEDILEVDDYDVTVERTGKAGLATALKIHPDLLILDIKLPDISGYQVYEALQQDAWGKQAKVLVLTASESLESIAKNINLSLEHVLFKPEVSVQALRKIIRDRLAS